MNKRLFVVLMAILAIIIVAVPASAQRQDRDHRDRQRDNRHVEARRDVRSRPVVRNNRTAVRRDVRSSNYDRRSNSRVRNDNRRRDDRYSRPSTRADVRGWVGAAIGVSALGTIVSEVRANKRHEEEMEAAAMNAAEARRAEEEFRAQNAVLSEKAERAAEEEYQREVRENQRQADLLRAIDDRTQYNGVVPLPPTVVVPAPATPAVAPRQIRPDRFTVVNGTGNIVCVNGTLLNPDDQVAVENSDEMAVTGPGGSPICAIKPIYVGNTTVLTCKGGK